MSQFSGPEEIYAALVEDTERDWLLGLVAFAVIEEQKIEWMKHQQIHNGAEPTSEDVQLWYQQQPEGVLLRALDTAEARLKDYSNVVVDEVIEDTIDEIKESVVVREVRELKRFWPQFGVNLAGGFASAILFTGLLIFMAFVMFNDSSPIQIGATIGQSIEAENHAKSESSP